jgi:hypothetical protein
MCILENVTNMTETFSKFGWGQTIVVVDKGTVHDPERLLRHILRSQNPRAFTISMNFGEYFSEYVPLVPVSAVAVHILCTGCP